MFLLTEKMGIMHSIYLVNPLDPVWMLCELLGLIWEIIVKPDCQGLSSP